MKVAILIPTFERSSFIQRLINYYDSLKCPHIIYIGDASNKKISDTTKEFLRNIKNVKVKYFHWENLNVMHTISKLAEEASNECSYCTFQGDEDFFIPSSLTRCAKFLSDNPEYTTVQGRAIQVIMNSNHPTGNIKFIREYWAENSLENDDKIKRLSLFNDKPFAMQFSLHHTNHFVSVSRQTSNIIDHGVYEDFQCNIFAINGKSKFIDCLYLVRVRHIGLIIHHYKQHDKASENINQKNRSIDFDKMLNHICHLLKDQNKESITEINKIVYKILYEKKEKDLKRYSSLNNTSKTLISKYIYSFFIRIKKIFTKFKSQNLYITKNYIFYDDFLPIKQSLTKKNNEN